MPRLVNLLSNSSISSLPAREDLRPQFPFVPQGVEVARKERAKFLRENPEVAWAEFLGQEVPQTQEKEVKKNPNPEKGKGFSVLAKGGGVYNPHELAKSAMRRRERSRKVIVKEAETPVEEPKMEAVVVSSIKEVSRTLKEDLKALIETLGEDTFIIVFSLSEQNLDGDISDEVINRLVEVATELGVL